MSDFICTAAELVERGIKIYNDRQNWTYVQGALGQLGESDRVRGLYNYFWEMPDHGGNSMTMPYAAWLNEYGYQKHCTDCCNFINFLLGYTFSMYSTKGYAAMKPFEGEPKDSPKGSVLCIINEEGVCTHVGLNIGDDEFLDFHAYNKTCRKGKISESLFNKAVYVNKVDYSKKPEFLEVNARDIRHYIGDEVKREDFAVILHYDDGSTKVLTEFDYTPLSYTNTVNVIAIVSGSLIGYVAVDALPKGTFYCVQIPATDKASAILLQQKLGAEGYSGAAVVEI